MSLHKTKYLQIRINENEKAAFKEVCKRLKVDMSDKIMEYIRKEIGYVPIKTGIVYENIEDME